MKVLSFSCSKFRVLLKLKIGLKTLSSTEFGLLFSGCACNSFFALNLNLMNANVVLKEQHYWR